MLEDLIEETPRQTQAEHEFADLIEEAYLAGMIDGDTQELAYMWLATNLQNMH